MRRLLASILVGILLAATAWTAPRVAAQDETPQQQKAAEFTRLWQRLQQTRDPQERISVADQALKLERELLQWPLRLARDDTRARLWWWRGLGYVERPLGERAENIERAIAAYEQALQILTREKSPKDWAWLHNNLANAYTTRILGERADNLEKAIAAYESTLTVFTRGTFPREWAATQNNLATAFCTRIRGERADNLEKAIDAYQAALTVRTREALAYDWAATQNNLANAYRIRIRGDRPDNLEKAIAAYETALTVRTRESLPGDWAQTQSNLANAYGDRVRGERADNLERAIAASEAALTVYTREALPYYWASTQNNLAIAYRNRIRGDRADNLEKAIAAYESALTVRNREGLPREWAETQSNLALAYQDRIRGERADNLERAIAAAEAALTVYTREALPYDWASAQNNLAIAYRNRIRGDRPDNMEKAIVAYEAALTVRTREGLPLEWAQTQNNLANTYGDRIRGERADNLGKAIAAYQAALTVFTRETLPRDHLRTARLLGGVLLETRKWSEAGSIYASAREAFLLLFGQGLNEAEARDLIMEAGPLFAEAAFAAVQRGESELALALASEGRARLMTVALKLQTLELPAEKREQLDQLRAAIRAERSDAEAAQGPGRAAANEKIVTLRQELLRLVKGADTTESSSASALAQARAHVASGGAIVVPVHTKLGTTVLIVTAAKAGQSLTVLDLPELTTDRLNLLVRGAWLRAYNIHYLPVAELNRRWPEWLAAVGDLGPELWGHGAQLLDAALKQRGLKPGARLIWLPSGTLGILPLGLAQDPVNKRRFADDYEIVYAPNLQTLASEQKQIAKNTTPTLAAIINPSGDLPGTEKEGKLVASYFTGEARVTILQRAAATPDAVLAALKGKTHWHFASHGTFSWVDARQSALLMYGDAPLSVGRLLETDGLGRPRLVVLSACETGLYDINRNPDEFIGLPGTFAALGAAGVVGTLWPVSDAATALLIAKFYELHMGKGLAPPTALSRAQAWLRQATDADLRTYARVASKQNRLESRHVAEIEQELGAEGLTRSRNSAVIEWVTPDATGAKGTGMTDNTKRVARPYAHPYFWAGFIYTGRVAE